MATQFRSIEEFKRFVDKLAVEIKDDVKLAEDTAKKLQARIIKADVEMEVLDISQDAAPATRQKRTTKTDFPVVTVPNKDKLKKNYAVAERMERQYQLLLQTEADLISSFPKAANANAKAVLKSLQGLKADLEQALRKLFISLNAVATRHAPKEYTKFVKSIADSLNEKLEFDSLDSFTYAALTQEDELIFTGYIVLRNAVSNEGTIAPHVYVAISWVVNGSIKVYVDHDFLLPTNLKHGTTVKDSKDALRSIETQLALEGFSSVIGALPATLRLKQTVDELRKGLTMRKYVTSIVARENELVFKVTDTKIANDLYRELKTSTKKGTLIRMRVKANEIVFVFSDRGNPGGISPLDLSYLQDTYGLSEAQLRRITNAISG